jgi:hypothetical protein
MVGINSHQLPTLVPLEIHWNHSIENQLPTLVPLEIHWNHSIENQDQGAELKYQTVEFYLTGSYFKLTLKCLIQNKLDYIIYIDYNLIQITLKCNFNIS